LQRDIATLGQPAADNATLERLRSFLADVPKAWDVETPEQKDKVARCLFEEVWIEG
jgi:hypothetical protein